MTLFALNSGSELGFLSLEICLFGCNVALLSIFGHKIPGSFVPRKTVASYTLIFHGYCIFFIAENYYLSNAKRRDKINFRVFLSIDSAKLNKNLSIR